MTYNFSSCINPCTSARKSWMIDPWHHHKFNPWYHNFDPSDHNRFDLYDNGLELNIQLPDINIPSCPPAPACPPCPQVKPEPKTIVDFSKLAITSNPITDDILDIKTKKPTGYKFKECAKIIQNSTNNLKVVDGKLVGSCEDNPECDKCIEIINGSIIDSDSAAAFLSTYNIPALEGNIHFL